MFSWFRAINSDYTPSQTEKPTKKFARHKTVGSSGDCTEPEKTFLALAHCCHVGIWACRFAM